MASDASIKTPEMIEALRQRHPEEQGEWTVFEEAWAIDFFAIRVWGGGRASGSHRRVGYEVKVSRSDYRKELLTPHKRQHARKLVHQFYMAVPDGLLKPHELAWTPPEGHEPSCVSVDTPEALAWRAGGGRGPRPRQMSFTRLDDVTANAPTLWVPADCGLVVVRRTQAGELASKIAKKSPRNAAVPEMTEREWVELARMSVNPTRYRGALAEAKAYRDRAGWLEDSARERAGELAAAYQLIEEAAVERPELGSRWRGRWPERRNGLGAPTYEEGVAVEVIRPSWMRDTAEPSSIYLRRLDAPRGLEHSVRLAEFIVHYRREHVLV